MILPILAYGHPKLRQECKEVSQNNHQLQNLIKNMWKTMYAAKGAGLAAPQIGSSLRLFIVDSVQVYENSGYKDRRLFITDSGIREVFINPVITERAGDNWIKAEGCLSIPAIELEIERRMTVVIKYLDADFTEKEKIFTGETARAVMHEYDHIEGILFTDYADKELIREKLEKITRGDIEVDYKMKFNKADGKP